MLNWILSAPLIIITEECNIGDFVLDDLNVIF